MAFDPYRQRKTLTFPGDLSRCVNNAQTMANAGQLHEAEAVCGGIIAAASAMPKAVVMLGFILGRLNLLDDAHNHLEGAIAG